MKTKIQQISAAATILACSLAAAPSVAQNLEYGNYLPPTHPTNVFALEPMFNQIAEASDGKLKINLHPGGALVGGKDTLSAIETNLVDGGFIVSVYVPNEIPLNNTISDMALLMADPITMIGALNETVLLDCPSCMEEYRGHNVVYLGAYATTPYLLMCKEPVATLSDVKGRKFRSAGGAYGKWIDHLGGVPVTIPNAEAYEAMQRGQLDCVHGSLGWLKSLSLWDSAKHVLNQGMGAFGGGALFAFNTDTWASLSDESRGMIVDHVPAALARLAVGYTQEDQEVLEKAADHGVTINKADPEVARVLAEYQKSEVENAIATAKKRGAENPEQLAEAYLKNLDKWKKISAEVGTDVDKLEAALRREIYSKIDLR